MQKTGHRNPIEQRDMETKDGCYHRWERYFNRVNLLADIEKLIEAKSIAERLERRRAAARQRPKDNRSDISQRASRRRTHRVMIYFFSLGIRLPASKQLLSARIRITCLLQMQIPSIGIQKTGDIGHCCNLRNQVLSLRSRCRK